ncbi:hypothetical protein RND81_13G054100 [Saponaria officinalis]|uniref:Protein arginine N-methyltransferase n=1 Tax=Saponaria officinalis TaxID=3572 RepID=A0AAW1GWB3_SAPOF
MSSLLFPKISKTLTPPHNFSLHRLPPPPLHINPRPTRAMSSESTQQHRIFQLKLDPLTGNSEWIVVDEYDAVSPAVDLATTSYLDMLNDKHRNEAYRLAIEKTVTRPCHVLDIGAGTGLLSMMAARAMGIGEEAGTDGDKGSVTACESYLPMVKLMRKVLRQNGMERKIKVINKRSDGLNVGIDINSRADILVSEILDSELLGEGLIPTLQHAHDHLLVKSPKTVPYRATIYGQLVESEFLWKLHDLYNAEVCTSDGVRLAPTELKSVLQVKPQQLPMHCDSLQEEIKLLSEPFKIFEFDFWRRPDSHGEVALHINATGDGRVNAVVSWWILQLDQEGTIFYSTAPKWIKELWTELPGGSHWCDHWKQCVWFVPGQGLSVLKGEDVRLHAIHSDISISYQLEVQSQTNEREHNSRSKDLQLILSPEKMATYSDANWRRSVLTALQNVTCKRDFQLCFVADDSVFLAMALTHLCKTSHVMLLFPGLRQKGFQYLQSLAEINQFNLHHLKLLDHRQDCLIIQDVADKKVDLLVGEPFYYGGETQLPWENLRFWKERTRLEKMLSCDAHVVPCKGLLRVCAMSLPDLWTSRRSLADIEGFDHSVANTMLGACGNLPAPNEGPMLPCYVWQCGETKELSEHFTLMEFDFSKPMSSCSGETKVEFIKSGICHGFVLWIDWVLDAENIIVVSTGPGHRLWRQGVKLLTKPVTVGKHGIKHPEESTLVDIKAVFDSSTGNLMIEHSFIW